MLCYKSKGKKLILKMCKYKISDDHRYTIYLYIRPPFTLLYYSTAQYTLL